jgi:hypothetical protein
MLFAGCDYNEDNFPELKDLSQPQNIATYDYELTSADITTIVNALRAKKTPEDSVVANRLNTDKAFSSIAPSATLIPYALKNVFFTADLGSSAKVTFSFVDDIPETVTALQAAESYTVSAADYETVWGADSGTDFFTPGNSPTAKLPAILATAFPAAKSGDIKVVRYNYSENEPSGSVSSDLLSEDFETNYAANDTIKQHGWTAYKETGDKAWQIKTYSGNFYAQMSNGSSGTYQAWMISPTVDLSAADKATLSFDLCVGYSTALCLQVLISTDANAATAPATASWDDITNRFAIPTTPASGYGPALESVGSADLSSYTGGTVYIAFRYDGDATSDPKKTTTYQIDNIKVESTASSSSGPAPTPQPYNAIYTYNGSAWVAYSSSAIVLNPADYDAMGVSSLTATTAPNYLPQFLAGKFPYAQEGTLRTVVYGSKTGNPGGNAAEYQLASGVWTPTAASIKKTEQYVVSTEGWLFDPTIVVIFKKTSGDNPQIQKFIDYVRTEMPTKWYQRGTYTNEEQYFGFNAYRWAITYGTDRTENGDSDIKDLASQKKYKELFQLYEERSKEAWPIWAKLNYPDLKTHVSGVEQKIVTRIEHRVFGLPSEYPTEYYEYTLKCIKSGTGDSDPAEFEYVGREQIPGL